MLTTRVARSSPALMPAFHAAHDAAALRERCSLPLGSRSHTLQAPAKLIAASRT